MCGVESPRWERYCDAAFPGRSAKPWGCGDGGEGRRWGSTRLGAATGSIPGPRSLGRAATPAMETPAGFPPPSTLAKLRLGFPPPAGAESSFRPGGGWGWGRRRESSLCGQHPSTRRGQSDGALRVSYPGAVRTGGFVGAGKARGPARTGLGEEGRVVCAGEREPGAFRV